MRNLLFLLPIIFMAFATGVHAQCFSYIEAVEYSGIANDWTVFAGDPVNLTVKSNDNDIASNEWVGLGSTEPSVVVHPIMTPTSYYLVYVQHTGNCVSFADATINVLPCDDVFITISENSGNEPNDGVVCKGSMVILTAHTDSEVLWSTGETTKTIVVIASETKTYSVSTTTDCNKSVEVEIEVHENPGIPGLAIDDYLLSGEGAVLTADVPGTWSNGSTCQEIVVRDLGIYYFTTENSYGCTATNGIVVNEFPECTGGDTTIIDTTIIIQNIIEVTDTFYIPEIIPCPEDSTGGTDTTGTVSECDDPIAIITSDDEVISYGQRVFLTAAQLSGSPIASVQWLPAEGGCPTCLVNEVYPSSTTNYKLVVTGENPACKAVDSILVCMEGDGDCATTTNVAAPDAEEQEVVIYPNPVLGEGSIKFDLPADSEWLVDFTSMDAKMAAHGLKVSGKNPEINIQSLDLPSAIYAVSILNTRTGDRYVKKLEVLN